METQKINAGRNAINFGLMLGLALIILDLLFYILNSPIKNPVRYLNIVVLAGFIIYGTVSYRDKHNNGFIKYGSCFLTGFLIALFAAIIYGIYYYLFIKFFDHSVINKIIEIAQQKIAEKMPGMDEDKIEEIVQMQRKYMTPFFISIGSFFSLVFWGTIMSLIISIFVKKEDNSLPIDNVQ